MSDFETILYEEDDGVAWVTLNRPDVHNAFNRRMQDELRTLWRGLRHNDDVRCVVLSGTGSRAFCTGIDRTETMGEAAPDPEPEPRDQGHDRKVGYASTPWMFDDPGDNIGPKSCDFWKPVIAAVNGMACGGAFYMLGEVEFIIAADHAVFFDPHVTYGMTAAFEPIHMLQKMPFQEIMRLSLLGSHERMSAQRALAVGLVSEVVPGDELHDAASWAAHAIASQPALAVGGTVRALWAGLELSRRHALDLAFLFTHIGTDAELIKGGQEQFASGRRIDWRLR
jgi:enoyl-CoA hydratase/carnithine racemase